MPQLKPIGILDVSHLIRHRFPNEIAQVLSFGSRGLCGLTWLTWTYVAYVGLRGLRGLRDLRGPTRSRPLRASTPLSYAYREPRTIPWYLHRRQSELKRIKAFQASKAFQAF